ncbi:MAG: glycosyltransferase family 1 protein [Chloroflexi bacterium]|nr:glycosyltransferase family 1 protein [Chloroflexota bacterium]
MTSDTFRIAMLSVHSCPVGKLGSKDTGGMSVYIRELARELGKRGDRVDIYTRAHDPSENVIVELGDNARIIHLQAGEVEPVDKLAVYSHLEAFARALEDFRERNELQYDVIHSHYWLSGWVGRKIQRRWDVPHVIMFHTLGAIKNAIGVGETEPALRIMAEKELAQDCQRIIAATEREKNDLGRYYDAPPDKISVIPCGVNLDLFQRIDKEAARRRLDFNGNKIILFVGRIEPLKGLDKLLAALPALDSGQEPLLVVVGGDERSQAEVERLRKLSRSLRIEGSVDFRGIEEQERLPLYYSAADVCVIPSYYESFGLVALESLACGTPIVATRVGCVESVIRQGQNGCMVEDNAPVRLADSIAGLLKEQNNGAKSADSIRASVDGYGWSNIAEAIVPAYREVVAKGCGCATGNVIRGGVA